MLNPYYRTFKVSGRSVPNSVAGALAPVIRTAVFANPAITHFAELSCIGAASVNQAIKALAILSGMVKPLGVDIAFVSAFQDVVVNNEDRTAIRLIVVRL